MLWGKIRTILRTYLIQRDWIFLKISASENHDSYFKVSLILRRWLVTSVCFLHVGNVSVGYQHQSMPQCDVGESHLVSVLSSGYWWRDLSPIHLLSNIRHQHRFNRLRNHQNKNFGEKTRNIFGFGSVNNLYLTGKLFFLISRKSKS